MIHMRQAMIHMRQAMFPSIPKGNYYSNHQFSGAMLVSGRVIQTRFTTVDGSEILRAPVEVGSLSHYLQGLYIPSGAGFLPSTVSYTVTYLSFKVQ